jgi:GntR family transcriptional regulator, gluconate operon transcriptional repressor
MISSLRALEKPSSLWQDAAVAVRRAILSGELKDGERVSEASLAELLGVSRAPVRDAMRILVQEGLLRQGTWATTVVGLTERDVRQLYDLRGHLEIYAIKQVAGNLDGEADSALAEAAERMREAAARGHDSLYTSADLSFHRALIAASHNRWLMANWEQLVPTIQAALVLGTHNKRRSATMVAESHLALLKSLREGDAGAAETRLRGHIEGAAIHLVEQFLRFRRPVEGETGPADDAAPVTTSVSKQSRNGRSRERAR